MWRWSQSTWRRVGRSFRGWRQVLGQGRWLPRRVTEDGIRISDRQFGRKIRKHAADYGLDPANPTHRAQLRRTIEQIGISPDAIVEGTFRGQGQVKFFIKGEDVVVTTPSNEFVTILKGGINNPSVRRALG